MANKRRNTEEWQREKKQAATALQKRKWDQLLDCRPIYKRQKVIRKIGIRPRLYDLEKDYAQNLMRRKQTFWVRIRSEAAEMSGKLQAECETGR